MTEKPRRRRIILAGLGALILVAATATILVWWRQRQATPHYVTQAVTRGALERSVIMTGTVEPVRTVQVGSYVSGIVKEAGCDFNSEVKVGQVCARIDPEPFQLVVDQTRADVATQEAQLRKDRSAIYYARLTYDRDTKLLTDGVVSADSVDSDLNQLTQAEAQLAYDEASLAQRKASLRSAEVNLRYTDIVSPVDGTVITRNVEAGQTVVSNLQSSTLFLIAKDLTKMQVDTNVAEADIAAVKVGQHANFTVAAYPDRMFDAVVKQIRQAPITVQNVVTYDVVLAVDNPDKALLPGMTADTHIIIAERQNVLRVPLGALRFVPAGASGRHRGGTPPEGGNRPTPPEGGNRPTPPEGGSRPDGGEHRWGPGRGRVWLLKGGKLTAVPVRVGLDDGTLVEITSDTLLPGDQVVLSQRDEDAEPRRPGNGALPFQQRRPGGGRPF